MTVQLFCNNSCRHCLRYVFGSVLQQDLQEFVQDWNEHPLRKNNRVSSPHGMIYLHSMVRLYSAVAVLCQLVDRNK